jgi:hypothetical protein
MTTFLASEVPQRPRRLLPVVAANQLPIYLAQRKLPRLRAKVMA